MSHIELARPVATMTGWSNYAAPLWAVARPNLFCDHVLPRSVFGFAVYDMVSICDLLQPDKKRSIDVPGLDFAIGAVHLNAVKKPQKKS